MKKISLTAPLALFVALMVPQSAPAAGGPVQAVQGSSIGVPGGPHRYAVLDAGESTVVKRQGAGAGGAAAALLLPGHYGIPGVDYSGSTTGLSADGRTLILAEIPSSLPPRTTRLLVLDTAHLAVRADITLRGWSTVDAISPDGHWLYLIHYPSADANRYEVQAYDVPARRLAARPIVDPRDRGEAMTGVPINRVMSANGRWAYTLYLRPSGVPFVHALDTIGRRAVCIDLPPLPNVAVGSAQLGLSPGGGTLDVDTGGVTQAAIDTRTLRLKPSRAHAAAATVPPVAHRRRGNGGQGDVSWELILLALAGLGVLGAGCARAASARHRLRTDRAAAKEKVPAA